MSSRVRILVAADDAQVRAAYRSFFADRPDVELVGEARTGAEAIEAYERLRPDLVLMDVVMPGLNGYQATRTLTRDETTKHIPVIVCTSKGQETDKIWGLRQGAQDYMVKPINQDELLAKIAAL